MMDNAQKPNTRNGNETFQFSSAGNSVELYHLDQQTDNAFVNYYSAYFGVQAYNMAAFEQDALAFFNRNVDNWNLHDRFFTNFSNHSESLREQGRYDHAFSVWSTALKLASNWERSNQGKRIHKGTPFYWLGVISIDKGNLDAGFIYIHRAVMEDKLTNQTDYRTLPPFLLVSLDYKNQRQAYLKWVQQNSDFLDGLLKVYRDTNAKNLTLGEFLTRFLKNPPTDETLSLFSYTLGRLYKLDQIANDALITQFAGQIELSLLFDLTIVIDESIDAKNPNPRPRNQDFHFDKHVEYLSVEAHLGFNLREYQSIVHSSPFDSRLADLLNGLVQIRNRPVSGLEKDIAVAYLIRNHGAHNALRERSLWNNFVKVRQSVFNMLFLAVEQLYV